LVFTACIVINITERFGAFFAFSVSEFVMFSIANATCWLFQAEVSLCSLDLVVEQSEVGIGTLGPSMSIIPIVHYIQTTVLALPASLAPSFQTKVVLDTQ